MPTYENTCKIDQHCIEYHFVIILYKRMNARAHAPRKNIIAVARALASDRYFLDYPFFPFIVLWYDMEFTTFIS